jgi:hypothetical protein
LISSTAKAHSLQSNIDEGAVVITASGLISRLEARLAEFAAIRRDIHKHPETAYEEFRTSAILADALASYGIEVMTGLGGTGVVGVLRAGGGDHGRDLARLMLGEIDIDDFSLPVTQTEAVSFPAIKGAFYEAGAQLAHLSGTRFA